MLKTQQLWAEKIWKNTDKKGNKKGALESLQMRKPRAFLNFYKPVKIVLFDGGDEEVWTLDLTDANRTLSQLSYAPICQRIISHGISVCQITR